MKAKTMFYCTECGNETPKWAGRPLQRMRRVEFHRGAAVGKAARRKSKKSIKQATCKGGKHYRFARMRRSVSPPEWGSWIEFLGGGAVKGSLVLVGGAPGIGKSTLMLRSARSWGSSFACYTSPGRNPCTS